MVYFGRVTAQLWDTEFHQPLHVPFANKTTLRHVTFSPDGRYLTYGEDDKKITLWTVGDERYEPSAPASSSNLQGGTQQTFYPSCNHHLLSMSVFLPFIHCHSDNLTGQ